MAKRSCDGPFAACPRSPGFSASSSETKESTLKRTSCTTVALAGLLVAVTCREARAVDGVIEINHARALAGGVTASDLPGYPITIDQSGSYRLTGNLTAKD